MSAALLLDELLAGFAPPPAADPGPAPAKAANAANREQGRGDSGDAGRCEGLRIVAKPPPLAADPGSDSQTFAALRRLADGLESERPRRLSQHSQNSQGWASAARIASQPARTCAGCAHRLPRGTCGEPEAAGLFPPGHGFGIAWPNEGHAANCPAFSLQPYAARTPRPYRLSRADLEAAHAEAWGDAPIARFQARAAAVQRRGFEEADAEDLAERLHLLDVQAEGRALCLDCRRLGGAVGAGWLCGNYSASQVGRELPGELVTEPQRCPAFVRREAMR